MKATIFYGNQRRGNTYKTMQIVKEELQKAGEVEFTEFFFPRDLPQFCTGCQLCLGSPNDSCPHSQSVKPILDAIIKSDALIFATPHSGASMMPAGMKNLFDHLDFLVLPIAPRAEIFRQKALIVTTGTGSVAASKEIKSVLKHWGVNHITSVGLRMFTNKWESMSLSKQAKFEKRLKTAARRFFKQKKRRPYLETIAFYYLSKFVLKRYIGPDAYPYQYWQKQGWFTHRPF
ncbi:MAG: NAD(P)H-dependent oxidoreductase [Erysipelotrichaceae bacterium]|jgi:multimeric flavodoxin WrbA|nr:NAD(P)H-dependent oxidoreductase [Erysipelotrichaceae bacterium]